MEAHAARPLRLGARLMYFVLDKVQDAGADGVQRFRHFIPLIMEPLTISPHIVG